MYAKDLFIVGSPWHTVIALAISNHRKSQAHFFIEFYTDSTKDGIERLIETSSLQHRIVGYGDWKSTSFEYQFRDNPTTAIINLYKSIRTYTQAGKDLQHYNFSAIFVANFNSPITRTLLLNSGCQTFHKIEDGISDYLDFNFTGELSKIKKQLKNLIAFTLGAQATYKRGHDTIPGCTIVNNYCFFPENSVSGNKKDLRNIKNEIIDVLSSGDIDLEKYENSLNSVLFIGQSLFEDKSSSLVNEISLYKKSITNLNKSGCHVLFKLHPRSCKEKILSIKEFASKKGISLTVIEDPFPVEILLSKIKFNCIVGMWSAPIIYARRIFGVESYTLMHSFLENPENGSELLRKVHEHLETIFPVDYIDVRQKKNLITL